MFLHILWGSLHMHHNIRHIQFSHCTKHIRIHLSGSNIIDDCHSIFFHTHPCHICPKSINRNNSSGVCLTQDFQSHTQTFHFFMRRNILRIRSGRICTDIYNSSTFIQDLLCPRSYLSLSLHTRTGIERIRSNI